MLNIELCQFGVYDTLKYIMEDLKSALEPGTSRKQKEEVISKTLGAVEALYHLIVIIDSEDAAHDAAIDRGEQV